MEATGRRVTIPVPDADLLTLVLRQGAQRMLAQVIRAFKPSILFHSCSGNHFLHE